MAPTKIIERDAPAVVTHGANVAPLRASRLPPALRFPVLLALNFFIHSFLWSTVTEFLGTELGAVSKVEDDLSFVLGRLAYRIGVLWFTWKANYDWIDVSALTVLGSAPYAYLLATYYDVSTLTVAAYANIEVLSIAIPTFLMRPRSPVHNPNAALRNRYLLQSFQVQWSTALLAICVYVVTIWGTLKTGWLNEFLVTYFDILTLEGAHNETAISLIIKVFTTGLAAKTFLLNPSIGVETASGTVTPVQPFDPATANLPQTLKHNFWFWDRRTRTLIRQTAVACAFILANTAQRATTLRGSEFVGAFGFAGVWVFATVVTAAWWVWVGDTDTEKYEPM